MRFLIYTGSARYRLSEELLSIGMGPEHVWLKPLPDLTIIADAVGRLLDGERGQNE